jgi:hypothetical protein
MALQNVLTAFMVVPLTLPPWAMTRDLQSSASM